MSSLFVSFWAGGIDCARNLPAHLTRLYASIGHSTFQQDPEVCAERELVPIEELLEPFPLAQEAKAKAGEMAKETSLRLAAVVVAVYTNYAPSEKTRLADPDLKFIGTFQR